MAVTRIWDADNGVWQLVGGTVGAEASGAGLYLPISGGTMTGPLILATHPTVPNQAATKQYVDDNAGGGGGGGNPTGSIIAFAGAAAPTGYLLCDGALLSRTEYATLFGVIGVAYGAGDGSTTFKLPDLRGKFPLGKAVSGTGSTLGGSGGAIDHDHTGPSHSHGGPSHSHAQVAHVHNLGNSPSSGAASPGTNSVGGHDHTVPSQSTSADSHAHSFSDSFGTGGPSDTYAGGIGGGLGVPTTGHSHSGSISGSTSSDSHSHTRAAISTDAVGNHSHSIAAHVHDLGNSPAGGATTTGTYGGGTTDAAGTGVTGTKNPPFQTVNYVIKI
jgi:microcystin-dependent protein